MARISLRPEFRFSREPGARQEASIGVNSRPPEADEKGVSIKRGRSLPAVSSPARCIGGIERCLRRGIKKGAIPETAGLRGGSWSYTAAYVRVSDRYYASWADTGRDYVVGARGARTP